MMDWCVKTILNTLSTIQPTITTIPNTQPK